MNRNVVRCAVVSLLLAGNLLASACGGRDRANDGAAGSGGGSAGGAGEMTAKVTEVLMGTAFAADGRVTTPATRFKGSDTIHVAVVTEGTAKDATLVLLVSAVGDTATIARESRFITSTGAQVTGFRLTQPQRMQPGKYRVEIFLNGGLAQLREFDIVR